EWDYVVHPGADPHRIRVRVAGDGHAIVAADGTLVVRAAGGAALENQLDVYQLRGPHAEHVSARFERLGADDFGLVLGAYDPALPLVVDPVLCFSTYLGSTEAFSGPYERARSIAADQAGTAYMTGLVGGADFPLRSPVQGALGGYVDAFVTAIDTTSSAL